MHVTSIFYYICFFEQMNIHEETHALRNRWRKEKEDSVFVDIGKVPYLFDEKVPELC